MNKKASEQSHYNVADFRDEAINLFQKAGTQEEPINQAKVKVSAGNMVLRSAKTEMKYNEQVGQASKQIDFLEC